MKIDDAAHALYVSLKEKTPVMAVGNNGVSLFVYLNREQSHNFCLDDMPKTFELYNIEYCLSAPVMSCQCC